MRERGAWETDSKFRDRGGSELQLEFRAVEEACARGVVVFVERMEPAHIFTVEEGGHHAG